MRPEAGDRGDVILGWLTKLIVLVSLLGVVGFDAVTLGAAPFTTEDHAQTAARAAGEAYRATPNPQTAYDAALESIVTTGDTIDAPTFAVAPDGSVTLTVRHETATLLVSKVPQLRRFTISSRTVTGRPPT